MVIYFRSHPSHIYVSVRRHHAIYSLVHNDSRFASMPSSSWVCRAGEHEKHIPKIIKHQDYLNETSFLIADIRYHRQYRSDEVGNKKNSCPALVRV